MSLDTEKLLESFGDEEPCGPDLGEGEVFFLNMKAQITPEQQFGDTVIAAVEPDYSEIKDEALEILGKSKDLRAAVIYAHAALRTDGLIEFAKVVTYIKGCVEQYWDNVHPMLDEDGDAFERVNTLLDLANNDTILRALRLAPLTESRGFGRFSLRDIQIATGEVEAPEGAGDDADESAISAAFQDTKPEIVSELRSAIGTSETDVKAMIAVLEERLGQEGPSLDPISKFLFPTLAKMRETIDEYAGAPEEDEPAADEGAAGAEDESGESEGSAAAAAPARRASKGVGDISSRKDVQTAITRICDWYKKNEPGSPVPVILMRAHRLVDANFETILKDLAPGGLEGYQMVAGVTPEEDEY